LAHSGPQTVDELFELPSFHHRSSVGIGTKRTMRIRPQFPDWSLSVGVELLTDVMDADTFAELVHLAGIAEGLGDNRVNGFGRFSAVVKPA
jgi:hypothetical protein